jgi:large-conductance mechanosensitive channel
MAKSFVQFLKQKITVSVLITVVVFNIFNPVADNLFEPLIGYIIDPIRNLDNSNIELNENYEIKYGMVIKKIIVAIIVLGLIYYVDRFFF